MIFYTILIFTVILFMILRYLDSKKRKKKAEEYLKESYEYFIESWNKFKGQFK